jgi:hypothetical protein
LLAFFKNMTGPSALIDFVKSGPWCSADEDVRFEILSFVDAMIIRRRERMGLPPLDDALPDQPLNVFLVLREHLASEFPSDDGATRGAARFDRTDTVKSEDKSCQTISPLASPKSQTMAFLARSFPAA